MTEVEQLARFVVSARFEDLTAGVVSQLKIRLLDSLGVAVAALDGAPIRSIRELFFELGGNPICFLIGGGASSPQWAAFYNGALVRYLDFMDSYLAPGETFHPSDNLGAVLAASEYVGGTGKDFLLALALSYQIQARLSEAAPVRARGFDHSTQLAYSAACGAAKALALDPVRAANAIAMSGTANNPLRITRTGSLSNWKGLAAPNTAFSALHCALLAMRGITGPLGVFEGKKGFKEAISGPFTIDWEKEAIGSGIELSILKKYDAEIHSQSALECLLELRAKHGLTGREALGIELETFQVAYDIIGGGLEGSKKEIRTKEEADHSLPYMLAVALLDGQLLPPQYSPTRIRSEDVQSLLRRVDIRPEAAFSARFPREMPARITLHLGDGRKLSAERSDYEGFHSRPMSFEQVIGKFRSLAEPFLSRPLQERIIETVNRLEKLRIKELTRLLSFPRKAEPMSNRAFDFVPKNQRDPKPRTKGLTEIRGPYYTVMGHHYLQDVLETMGEYVDGLKFAGGSFSLIPEEKLRELIEIAHRNDVYVSTGGWIERVLCYGPEIVGRYMRQVKDLGFDVIELSVGFISLPADDLLRLIDAATRIGLNAKPELGIQFGAGGATSAEELEAEGTKDVNWLIRLGKRCLDAGASIIMIESEGITESVRKWREDVPIRIINELGLENIMFEAADPEVFQWYVKNYGIDVNLFIDHSQIVELEALRSGIWGTKSTWGRVVSYREEQPRSKKKAA